MFDFTMRATTTRSYADTVTAVRAGLRASGFDVMSEIDLKASLEQRLGVQMPNQVIFSACRPQLTYQAVQADPSVAALMPCNVVVRSIDSTTTVVESIDPAAIMAFAGTSAGDPMRTLAEEMRRRLSGVLDSVAQVPAR